MTYADAIKAGYKDGGTKYQRGYISRRVDTMAQPVRVAGGNRKGQLYVLLPSYDSTRYCVRRYLYK